MVTLRAVVLLPLGGTWWNYVYIALWMLQGAESVRHRSFAQEACYLLGHLVLYHHGQNKSIDALFFK